MSQSTATLAPPKPRIGPIFHWWRVAIPVALTLALATLPPPPGLAQHAWYYFAIFAGVIAALVTEPLPNPAVGMIGLSLMAVVSHWVLYSPADQAKPGFNVVSQTISWALSGFASTTVWLVGRRVHVRPGLSEDRPRPAHRSAAGARAGQEHADGRLCHDAVGRRAGAVHAVQHRTQRRHHLPDREPTCRRCMTRSPNDASARRFGGYIMWTTFAAGCITSSLFMTACAPNFLAIEFIRKIAHVDISYMQWMKGSLPFALPLLLVLPLLTYVLYPPEIKHSAAVTDWAGSELGKMGRISRHEVILAVLVSCAILLWVLGGSFIDATLTAFVVISLMLVTGVRDLGRHGEEPFGLDDPGAAGDAGDAGRRAVAFGVRQMVRRISSRRMSAAFRRR